MIRFEVETETIKISPRVRDILLVLGVMGFVSLAVLMPGLPRVLTPLMKKQYRKWGHFNQRRLRSELKRMQTVGLVKEIKENGEVAYRLTEKGKNKSFKYKLEEIDLSKNKWDGKWRIVAYDIPKDKKNQAEAFRNLLKKMSFYQLQKSVWLTPYQCNNEIEFLKNLYSLTDNVTVLTTQGLESEQAYRNYFGL
ncbi:MAG: CRISPR-associated endonuclease Cas2 [Candidatus Daviesbacteria bacterium]|nr:CRISPR-associated endonuclease Cas2 [Candidatus Daviesbacteria bacterium]